MQNRNKCQGYERGNGMTPPREAVGSNRGLSSPGSLEGCIGNTEVPGGWGLGSMGEVEQGENRNCPDSSAQIWKEQKSHGIPGLTTSGALRIPVSVPGSVVRLGAAAQPLLCRDLRASRG